MDYFRKGLKDANKLKVKDRSIFLYKVRKIARNSNDVLEVIKEYFDVPVFRSVIDKYEYISGFLVGISYITRKDVLFELEEMKKLLGIGNISNTDLRNYYVLANKYFDKGYGRERIVVSLVPKKGSLAKGKTRVPKEKDFEKLKFLVREFRDLFELYMNIEERKYLFFNKIS